MPTTASRVAIVTGASRGIGRATARRLAADYDHIVAVARTGTALQSLADELSAQGRSIHPVAADMKLPTSAGTVVEETLTRFGRIDAVVNIAGAVKQGSLFELQEDDWADGMALKLHGARRLVQAAWPALVQQRGCAVFMSGTAAQTPKPLLAAVATINAAILALAKVFSEQGLKDGGRVNSVLPGPVLTDRRRTMLEKYAASKNLPLDQAMNRYAEETGIIRYGQPEDIAEFIAFLVSPSAAWITGSAFRVDGGEVKTL